MTKFKILKLLILLFLLLIFAFLFKFFQKEEIIEEDHLINNEEIQIIDNQTEKISPAIEEKELEKLKTFLESFSVSYFSYDYENFYNIESLQYLMTNDLLEQSKEELGSRTNEYKTVEVLINSSEITAFSEEAIVLKINIQKKYYNGSNETIFDSENVEQTVIKDINGEKYEGSLDDLLDRTEQKNIEISAVKQNGEWRVKTLTEID